MRKLNKLIPVYKDYIWGGNWLREHYNKNTDLSPLAESWECSTHPDGISEIGETNLLDYIKTYPDCLGTKCKETDIPILIKYIDSKEKVSIQVHPDDDYARTHENDNGKTELWYVVEADENAYVYLGTNKDISLEEFEESILKCTVTNYLNKIPVKKGDVFLVEAGTLHAIGEGCLLVEIQERSNVTYRIYDYNRKDKNGNLRPLHIQKALEVVNLKKTLPIGKPKKDILKTDDVRVQLLEDCKYFKVYYYRTESTITIPISNESFSVMMFIQGYATITTTGERITVMQGESVFLNAGNYDVMISGKCELLLITL